MKNNSENKLVPSLRFPEFNNDGEWKPKTILDLALNGLSNGVFNDPEKVGYGYKLINVSDMYSDFPVNEENLSLVGISQVEFLKNKVEYGDIFFTRSSLVEAGIAQSNIYLGSSDDITYDGHLVRLRPDVSIAAPKFLHYLLKTNSVRSQLIAKGKRATMTTIGQSDIATSHLSHPSKSEQEKIASCLSALDEVIKAESQKLEILQDHKKGLLQNLLPQEGETVPKFRFKNFEDSADWEETTLTQVADYENGKAHEQDIDDTGNFIVVNSKFISQDGKVKKFTKTAFLPAQKGDVLMVLSDIPNGKAIAKCFLVEEANRYTVNQRICRITPHKLNSKILYYLLNRNQYFLAFDDGVKQTNLKKEDVLNCPLLIPSDPKEQEKIAETLSTIDDLIIAQSQKVKALMLHKKGLLQGLFPNVNEVTE